MTSKATDGGWLPWPRLAVECVVIVVGVLVALGVDAAWDAREDRLREAAYLRQLRADLTATANDLEDAVSLEQRAQAGADRVIQALNSSRLPPSDSLVAWTTAATNSSASFSPTMGTLTALVESGELRLIRDGGLRQEILRYHSSVESALRIVGGVTPHMWRAMERLGEMLSWAALLRPEEAQRFPIDWDALASNRSFHGALYDLRLSADNRIFALRSLRDGLESLLAELDSGSR